MFQIFMLSSSTAVSKQITGGEGCQSKGGKIFRAVSFSKKIENGILYITNRLTKKVVSRGEGGDFSCRSLFVCWFLKRYQQNISNSCQLSCLWKAAIPCAPRVSGLKGGNGFRVRWKHFQGKVESDSGQGGNFFMDRGKDFQGKGERLSDRKNRKEERFSRLK